MENDISLVVKTQVSYEFNNSPIEASDLIQPSDLPCQSNKVSIDLIDKSQQCTPATFYISTDEESLNAESRPFFYIQTISLEEYYSEEIGDEVKNIKCKPIFYVHTESLEELSEVK
jgi:hypothetical protein